MKLFFRYSCAISLLLILCCGCNDKLPLGGTITYSDDGSPLDKGTVCFEKADFLARGHLQSDGTYQISSTGKNDGLPKGKYKVCIVGAELSSEGAGGNTVYTPLIDQRYGSAETTDIEFDVDGKTRRFDFQVDRAK